MQRPAGRRNRLVLSLSSALCLVSATDLPAQSGQAEVDTPQDRQTVLEARLAELLRYLPSREREYFSEQQTAVEDRLSVRFKVRQQDEPERLRTADAAAGGRGARWTEMRFAEGRLHLEGVAAGARAWGDLLQHLVDSGLAVEARHHTEAGCHRGTLAAKVGTVSDEVRYSVVRGQGTP